MLDAPYVDAKIVAAMVNEAPLKRYDKVTGTFGTFEVLQVHPPQGKRRDWLYTVRDVDTHMAEQVSHTILFAKEHKIVIDKD